MAKKEPKERKVKILNKDVDKINESIKIMKDYLVAAESESFKTYCNLQYKNCTERQSIIGGIDTLETCAKNILNIIDNFRAKDKQAQIYEESIYQEAMNTILTNARMGKDYNNGFAYDIFDFYRDFGQYPFIDRLTLYKKASKLSKEDNIAINKVIGGVSQISDPIEVSMDLLLQDPYTITIKTEEININHSFTYQEKKEAIIYMTTNNIPLCKEYFYKVLRKILFGGIKIETQKSNTLIK